MLYLASQSPRRRHLLEQIGISFQPLLTEVMEQRMADETPLAYVQRVARDKALAGLTRLAVPLGHWVLGADTEVILDGEVFGKPVDADGAAAMLRRLAGRVHQVMTAVCLMSTQSELTALSVSQVRFAPLTEADIAAYVASGEPLGKAGGYAIQGRGAVLVEYLEGSYSGVMGLPLFHTARLLCQAELVS